MSSRYCETCNSLVVASETRCLVCGWEFPEIGDSDSRNSPEIWRRRDANADVWWGIALCAVFGGIIVGMIIYAQIMGFYFLLWGPLIYGLYRILKGILWASYPLKILAVLVIGILTVTTYSYIGADVGDKINIFSKSPTEKAMQANDEGVLLAKEGKYAEALIKFNLAIYIKPQSDFLSNRGINFYNLGQFQLALNDLDDVLKLDPNDYRSHAARGIVYQALDNHKSAIKDFNNSLNLKKDGIVFFTRSESYLVLQEYTKALSDVNEAIKLDPENPEYLGGRALLHFYFNDFVRALDDFNKTLQIDPNNARAYRGRSWIHENNGEFNLAQIDQRRACELDPKWC